MSWAFSFNKLQETSRAELLSSFSLDDSIYYLSNQGAELSFVFRVYNLAIHKVLLLNLALVPVTGLQPVHPEGYLCLKQVRLAIPPYGLMFPDNIIIPRKNKNFHKRRRN